MLKDLSKSNTKSVNLEDYDLPESLFKGSGLKKDVDTSPESTPGSNYYAVSAQQLDMTMTQLAVFMHDFHFTKRDGDEINYDMGVTYD